MFRFETALPPPAYFEALACLGIKRHAYFEAKRCPRIVRRRNTMAKRCLEIKHREEGVGRLKVIEAARCHRINAPWNGLLAENQTEGVRATGLERGMERL